MTKHLISKRLTISKIIQDKKKIITRPVSSKLFMKILHKILKTWLEQLSPPDLLKENCKMFLPWLGEQYLSIEKRNRDKKIGQ